MMEHSKMKSNQIWKTLVLFTLLTGSITPAAFGGETSPTLSRLENATYTGIEDEPVTL